MDETARARAAKMIVEENTDLPGLVLLARTVLAARPPPPPEALAVVCQRVAAKEANE